MTAKKTEAVKNNSSDQPGEGENAGRNEFTDRAVESRTGLPSYQINNQIYQSDQLVQTRYRILSDRSIQIQASIHLIHLIFLIQRAATLELPDHPFVPAPKREALSKE